MAKPSETNQMKRVTTKFPKHRRAVAYDLASATGFAVLDNGLLEVGTHKVVRRTGRKREPDEHVGIKFSRLEIAIWRQLQDLQPDVVFYEESTGNYQSVDASRVAFGFRALLLACCARLNIPTEGYSVLTIKKYFTGSGRAQKDDMMFECRQRFRELVVDNDNEADAVAILCYGMSVRYQVETI